MKYITDKHISHFPFSDYAMFTFFELTYDELDTLDQILSAREQMPTADEIEDLFRYHADDVAVMLGYENWTDFIEHHLEPKPEPNAN